MGASEDLERIRRSEKMSADRFGSPCLRTSLGEERKEWAALLAWRSFSMNIIRDNVKKLFLRFLFPSFGSAIIASVYSLVDLAMVGQYQGSEGTAALAAVAPLWNVVYSIGLWGGIGGSVLYSEAKGRGCDKKERNQFFTTSLIITLVLLLAFCGAFIFFKAQIFTFFGASEDLLPLCEEYVLPILFVLPTFGINQFLASFLRNDDDPNLAMGAVLGGGVFNVVGDYVFVFVFNLGMFGAGLATAIGSVLTLLLMLIHFLKKKNTLGVSFERGFFLRSWRILRSGFSSFFVDFAMGVVTVFFNQQVMKHLGADALSVYGVILNVNTFVQCCAYGVGQAAQPIISANFGAKEGGRVKLTLRYCLVAVAIISTIWGVFSLCFPNLYLRLFVSNAEDLFAISEVAVRLYAVGFFVLPFNVFSTYYFQSILKSGTAFLVSMLRGFVLSVAFIFLIPYLFGANALWLALPCAEIVTMVLAVVMMVIYTKRLPCDEDLTNKRS